VVGVGGGAGEDIFEMRYLISRFISDI